MRNSLLPSRLESLKLLLLYLSNYAVVTAQPV
jgi:hypothetical protein